LLRKGGGKKPWRRRSHCGGEQNRDVNGALFIENIWGTGILKVAGGASSEGWRRKSWMESKNMKLTKALG